MRWFLVLIVLLLLAGCSGPAEVGIHEGDGPLPVVNGSSDRPVTSVQDEVPFEPVVLDRPVEVFSVEMRSMELSAKPFADEEQHELRVFASSLQEARMLSLRFRVVCEKPSASVAVVVEGQIIDEKLPTCNELVSYPLPLSLMSGSRSSILIRSHVTREVDFEDVALVVLSDDGEEVLAAEPFTLSPGDGDEEVVEYLDPVLLSNRVERSFVLKEVTGPLTFSFKVEGDAEHLITVELNGVFVLAERVEKDHLQLVLPQELLRVGENVLVFVTEG